MVRKSKNLRVWHRKGEDLRAWQRNLTYVGRSERVGSKSERFDNMAAQPQISATRLALEAWRSGRRCVYFERHPLTFPTLMRRQLLLSLGAKRAEVDRGFADPAEMRGFIRRVEGLAAAFAEEHDGEVIGDGEFRQGRAFLSLLFRSLCCCI